MIRPTELAQMFSDNAFREMTFSPDGAVTLTFGACVCDALPEALDSLGPVTCASAKPSEETWRVELARTHQFEVTAVLVTAWRLFTASQPYPWITFGNVNCHDTGWGGLKPSPEQVKLALQLIVTDRRCRVYHDRVAAFQATYGATIDEGDGHIALQVDDTVYIVSRSGYLTRTALHVALDAG